MAHRLTSKLLKPVFDTKSLSLSAADEESRYF